MTLLSLIAGRRILECVTALFAGCVMEDRTEWLQPLPPCSSWGTKAPAFELPDVVSGKTVFARYVSRQEGANLGDVHLPSLSFVKHIRSELAQLGRDYAAKGVGIVAISSNDPGVSA